ncbi:MAG: DUF4159 domain-containing protein [Deltaproteobacteria bacterium]|nr:DUF4159 domain-containing protein [Deltaproteobacteria bacterium]MCB9788355.1 DUF4159 domain-containing protein [Deltaproteobacteria bacterium]
MDRRRFLQTTLALGALAAAPRRAFGIGPAQDLHVSRIRYDGNWSVHAGAGSTWAEEVGMRTSVDVSPQEETLGFEDRRFAERPFAFLAGDRDFALRDGEQEALRRWLELGGLLFIDNAGQAEPSEAFDRAVRRELARLFPKEPLSRISPEHVLYRSFYRLDYPAGRAIRKPWAEGLAIGRRYGVILSHNDVLGALAREPGGRFAATPTPGGESQREMAMRFAVNVVMYAMCLHYKDDQVHLDYLLHNRKWKIRRPE